MINYSAIPGTWKDRVWKSGRSLADAARDMSMPKQQFNSITTEGHDVRVSTLERVEEYLKSIDQPLDISTVTK